MQVTKIINRPYGQSIPTSRKITSDQLQREIDYWRSKKILQKMLKAGLISEVEFNKIDTLNRQSFSPMLAHIMP